MAEAIKYFKLTEEYTTLYGPKMVILYLCGEWYEVYALANGDGTHSGSCIDEIHHFLGAEISVPKEKTPSYNNKQVVKSGVKMSFVSQTIRALVGAGYTVPKFDQIKSYVNGKEYITRELAKIYTPGTYDDPDSVKHTNYISCYWFHYEYKDAFVDDNTLYCGMVMLDVFTGKINYFEYKTSMGNHSNCFDSISSYHQLYLPKEVIIISDLPESLHHKLMNHTLPNSTITMVIDLNDTKNKATIEASKCKMRNYQLEFISAFYPEDKQGLIIQMFSEYYYSSYALCYLLNYVRHCNAELTDMLHIPIVDADKERLYTGNHSLQQLNIIETNAELSLQSFLNNCKTVIGKRLFRQQLLSPITNVSILNNRYTLIEYAIQHYESLSLLYNKLSCLYDIERLRRFIIQETITPTNIINVLTTCKVVKEIFEDLATHSIIQLYCSKENISGFCEMIQENIESVLDVNIAKTIRRQDFSVCFIQRGVRPVLDKHIEASMDSHTILVAIVEYLNDLLLKQHGKGRKPALIKLDIPKTKTCSLIVSQASALLLEHLLPKMSECNINYYSKYSNETKSFVLKINDIKVQRSSTKKGYYDVVHDIIIEKSELIQESEKKMSMELSNYYKSFVKTLKKTITRPLMHIIDFIGYFDTVFTNAKNAQIYHFSKPVIKNCNETSYLNAKQLRHPLIEHINKQEVYVPNDICLGLEPQGILLYGTNAVGKTSLIRSIGICITMAQCGMFVPCKLLTYYPYQQLFTRILGNDNLFKGMSTFDVEMSELLHIVQTGSKHSLVLGDEICSGTETISATSFIPAIVKWLYNKNMSFMFATHYHELSMDRTIQELKNVVFKHMKIRYDHSTQKLYYDRVLADGPGKCLYGLEVCKYLGYPKEIMDLAYQIREENNPNMVEQSIFSLTHQSRYNKHKLKRLCEICKKKDAVDIDHIMEQKHADENGFIDHFHKNHPANLQGLCKDCHKAKTKSSDSLKKMKTIGGSNSYHTISLSENNQNLIYPD